MRFRAPAHIMIRRAQLTLILAVLVPTILMTALGIVLLAVGNRTVAVVAGVLVIAFCASAITGYILGSIYMRRGASMARVQTDFLSSVSHELRTPITSLQMFVETLREERVTDPAERRRCLDIMLSEMQRLEVLVTRLIDLSRIEAGRHMFRFEPTSIESVVDGALTALRAASLQDEPDIEMEIELGLYVNGDRSALSQAIGNLLINAYKYTPQTGRRIELRAHGRGKEVEIVVADNGPGISRAEQRMIFEKFERGKAATEAGQTGSGLGLAIVRAIVDAHRGKISVRSDTRSGSRFSILLPRTAT